MGAIGSCFSFATIKYIKRFNFDDTLDVFACHGVGGIVGSILTGIFASKEVNPAGADGLLYGDASLLIPQIEETLAGIIIATVGTWTCLKIVSLFTSLRVDETDFDASVHAENAYGDPVPTEA